MIISQSAQVPAPLAAYLDKIEAFCAGLSTFPARGVDRRDIGPGIRTHALARRVLVAYRLTPERVEILRVLYAGRDFSSDDVD